MTALLFDGARARRFTTWGCMFLALIAIGAVMMSVRAAGQTPFSVVVTPIAGTATDVVDLEGVTYDDAKAGLAGAEAGGSATIPVDVANMPPLTSASAEATTDDATFSVAVRGTSTVLATPAQLLVTATWDDAADTDPDVAVLVRFDAVDLSVLNESWTDVPVSFGPAIVGLTDTAHTVSPSNALGTDLFLADGLVDTSDDFPLIASGVNLSAVVGSGDITEAAEQLGGATTSGIRVRGSLSASVDVLEGTGSGGLALSVDIPVTTPTAFPDWVELSSPWTLGLTIDTNGDASASFSGGLTVTPDGATPVTATGTATVSIVGGSPSLTLDVGLGPIPDLFGQTWLDLDGANLTATIGTGGFSGGIDASLTLGPVTADIALALETSNGDLSATLDLTATGPVSSTDLIDAIGASTNGIDANIADVTLNQIALHVAVDKPSGAPAAVTVSVFGDASLTINAGSFDAQMLFRTETGSSSLLVAGRLTSPSLQELDPTIPFDWNLPDIALVASNQATTLAYADLDTPTQLYFAPVLCEDPADSATCGDLELTQGLVIEALVELPQDLQDQLGNLGITVTGPIGVTGTLPILGGTELSLELALPEVLGADDDLVKSGQVSFRIATDTVTRQVEASIDGSMVFRITRATSGDCDGTEDGTWPASTECYDELTLTVSASVTALPGPPPSVEINLTGTISEWDRAFGLDWLNIETLRLQLGLKAGGANPVSLTVGMLGQFVIGDATESSDLTLAIKLEITPTPPWINLTGFTAASGDGIRLQSVASAIDPTFDASTLPDLALKRLFLSYGTETDESLCIRQGFFISAELHLGAAPATGSTPGCLPGSTIPDDPADLPTAGCADTNTCLASILIDVQTGPSPSFTAAGFIRGFEAGPITIDDTEVVLQLSATQQRFYLSGGATITDITGVTTDVWASGDLTIDFRNDAGNASLLISGTVNIGGEQGLTASLTGAAAADFSLIGSGDITGFLASLDFEFDYEFTFPALEEFGDQVEAAFAPVDTWLDGAGNEITSAFDPDSNQDLQSFIDLFAPVEDAPEYAALQGYTGALGVTADTLQLQASVYYNYISDYWQLRFYDVIINGNRQNARIYFMEQVGIRLQNAINDAGGIGNITLYGIDRVLIPGQDIGLEEITDFRIRVTGVCNTPGNPLAGSTLCTGGVSELSETTLAALASDLFTEQTGYTLPTGTAAARQVAGFRLAAAATAPPTNALEAINRLNGAFTTGAVEVTCATVSVRYSPEGNSQDPAVVTVNAYGTPASVEVELDPKNLRRPIDSKDVVQESIDTILSATTPPEACKEPAQPVGPGGTSVRVAASPIDEGGTASVSGVAEAPYFGKQITITWGDGTTSVATASATDGSWSSSHVYPDDEGAGTSQRYLISATAEGVVDFNYTRITVVNVTPTLVLAPVAATVNEGGALSVRGTFSDPGVLDGHTLVVSWGDGTPNTTVQIAAGQTKSFSVLHTYVDDNPTLTPRDGKTVSVRLTDSDGASVSASSPVTVQNLAPTDLQLVGVSVDGTPVSPGADGRFAVPEAGSVTVSGTLRDVGRADTHRVSVDWGDESRGAQATVTRDAVDPTLVRFTATHVYVDDDPTTSESDVYTITMIASDDDTGKVDETTEVRVADVAPVVTVDPIAGTTENVGITMNAAFTDVGTADTHTAVVDWGDGTPVESLTITAGAMTANHTYGDNGVFTLTVTVTDDDSLSDSASATVTVVNTVPTVSINRSGTITFDGVQTVVGTQNVPTPFSGPITDPGSDDVTVSWAFGDSRVNTLTNLVNPPGSDPAISPSIQPRSFTSSVSNAYARPCLYTATLSATDDDGGIATPDSVPVVVVGSPKGWQQSGYWKNAYSGRSAIPAADLTCYLRIIEHTSQLFGPGDLIPLARPADVQVLFKDTTLSAELFDRDILVAWLNVANGSLALRTQVDLNGDGTPDATVAKVLADAELVRLNPASTKSQIDAARKSVNDLVKVAIR